MRTLSAADKEFLVRAYDYRAFRRTGEFHDPAARRVQRLERLYLQLQKISRHEPTDHGQRVLVVKRWFRPPLIVDAPPLIAWKALMAEAQATFDKAYIETKDFLESRVYADQELLRELDMNLHRQEKQRLADEQAAQERAAQDRKEAEHKEAETDAEAKDANKRRRTEVNRVRQLNEEQANFHGYLDRKDKRWRDSMR